MNLARQRAICILACVSMALVGCEARSSVEAAQTAVVFAQTALPGVQGVLPGVQGVLPGTVLEIKTSPDGAAKDAVTDVSIQATDAAGTLASVDTRTRQAAATAALLVAAQYYPNATISLNVVDSSGTSLISATRSPGQAPSVQ